MHGGVYAPVAGDGSEDAVPVRRTKDDANDAALKQKADAFVHGAVETISDSKAWSGTRRSSSSPTRTTSPATPRRMAGRRAAGCCDSPYVPDGSSLNSGGLPDGHVWHGRNGDFHYGGGLSPAIVVTRTVRAASRPRRRTTTTRC